MEYDHLRSTRRCAVTQREFGPGEIFYSVLTAENAALVRRDYSADVWKGAPEGVIASWKTQMPGSDPKRLHWAPNDVMLDLLEQLADDAAHAEMRYVLALLLIRRRVCRLEETQLDEQKRETLLLVCPRRETQYRVAVAMPDAQRTQTIQDELAKLLFAA